MTRTGFMHGKRSLSPDSEVVRGGLYSPTTLSTVDSDLAIGNIKSGITIFGKAGSADVQDISDATAVEAEVLSPETFYAAAGGIRTGTMPTEAITAVNDDYPAGYHIGNVGGLSAIDAQLAAANILSGVTIFGFAGPATVQDIGDADAAVGDVKTGIHFYSVTGGRKTGTMDTVALNPANSDYPAGYHAGEVGGLVDVDAQLVTANIKSGITIFGIAGHDDVRNISDGDLLEAEAPTGKFFYAVSGGRRTGTGTKTLNAANDTVAAGYYAATTLHDVDGDLAVGNIKEGVTIFGFLGTFAGGALAEDTTATAISTVIETNSNTQVTYWYQAAPEGGTDTDLATTTPNFDANSIAVGVGSFQNGAGTTVDSFKLRVYLGGVMAAESAFMVINTFYVICGTRALSGDQECKVTAYNTTGAAAWLHAGPVWADGQAIPAGIGVGSIKA